MCSCCVQRVFYEKVLVPLLPLADMKFSLELRGDAEAIATGRNKLDYARAMADVLDVEDRLHTATEKALIRELDLRIRVPCTTLQMV